MKKLDFFFLMVLICTIGMVGCSQQDAGMEPAEKTAEIEISISKAEFLKSGAVDEGWYCPAELPSSGQATVYYSVEVIDAEENSLFKTADDKLLTQVVAYTSLNDEGAIQSKIQLNWKDFYTNATGAESLIITVEAVTVGSGSDEYTFAAPNADALYASYIPVESQIERPVPVKLYEKVYMDVKVLCFNEQDIPEFGFSWFDFEIITGEEVCVYFNCLDANGHHQNVTTDYTAEFLAGYDNELPVWKTYWTDGIADTEDTYALNCIVLPANYATEGIQVTAGNAKVKVTPADIAAFLDPTNNDTYSRTKVADVNEVGYTVTVDNDNNGAYFLHFVLNNCEDY